MVSTASHCMSSGQPKSMAFRIWTFTFLSPLVLAWHSEGRSAICNLETRKHRLLNLPIHAWYLSQASLIPLVEPRESTHFVISWSSRYPPWQAKWIDCFVRPNNWQHPAASASSTNVKSTRACRTCRACSACSACRISTLCLFGSLGDLHRLRIRTGGEKRQHSLSLEQQMQQMQQMQPQGPFKDLNTSRSPLWSYACVVNSLMQISKALLTGLLSAKLSMRRAPSDLEIVRSKADEPWSVCSIKMEGE